MVTLYNRDAAVVASLLSLVVTFRRADISQTLPDTAEAILNWETPEIRDGDPTARRELTDSWLDQILAAIKEQQ